MDGDERAPRARSRVRPALQHLEIFLKVVEARSFVGAARLLGISQPAVSQAIARLEDIYPGNLFVRGNSAPLALTPVGEALLPLAEAMLHTADQSFFRAHAATTSRIGRLSVGFHPGLAAGPLRAGLCAFRAECPDVELDLVEGMPSELYGRLCDRSLDVIFVAFMPEVGTPLMMQESLWSETLVAVLPEDHLLAGRSSLNWSHIAKLRIILRTANGDLSGYKAILARVGDAGFRCTQYAVSRGTLLQMVTMGFGITILFSSAVQPTPGLVIIPVEGERMAVPIDAIWHGGDDNAIRHRLMSHVRSAAKM